MYSDWLWPSLSGWLLAAAAFGADVVGREFDVFGLALAAAFGLALAAAAFDVVGRELDVFGLALAAAAFDVVRRELDVFGGRLAGDAAREGRECDVAHLRCQMQRVVGTLHASPVALGAIVGVFLRRWSALAHGPTVTVRCRAPQPCRIQAFPASSRAGRAHPLECRA